MNATTTLHLNETRQVRRCRERAEIKRATRPGPMAEPLFPDAPKADRRNSRIVWTKVIGRTEFYLHATKGLRHRYLGGAA